MFSVGSRADDRRKAMQEENLQEFASPRPRGSSAKVLTAEEIKEQHEQVRSLARAREKAGVWLQVAGLQQGFRPKGQRRAKGGACFACEARSFEQDKAALATALKEQENIQSRALQKKIAERQVGSVQGVCPVNVCKETSQ